MDTTPPSGDDVMNSSEAGGPPPSKRQQLGQDFETGFEEPVQPVEPEQPPPPSFGEGEQYQWPQQEPQQSLGLTATNPELAQVLPAAALAETTPFGGDYSSAESANSSSVAPSAPPPMYDQVAAGQGTVPGQLAGAVGGGVQSGYDPAYQNQAPPPGSAYFPPAYGVPPPGPYDYQYGAPPPPVGGAVPPYGQQYSNPASSQSYASTANWGSSFETTGSAEVPSQQDPFIPTVDRSTKPTSSLNALSTGWGGKV